jgi:hypothetical protein
MPDYPKTALYLNTTFLSINIAMRKKREIEEQLATYEKALKESVENSMFVTTLTVPQPGFIVNTSPAIPAITVPPFNQMPTTAVNTPQVTFRVDKETLSYWKGIVAALQWVLKKRAAVY